MYIGWLLFLSGYEDFYFQCGTLSTFYGYGLLEIDDRPTEGFWILGVCTPLDEKLFNAIGARLRGATDLFSTTHFFKTRD